ncbi:hypothetical protein WMY93_010902 [Mugilogobius chulae]|uniref:CENP-T/Histone H4 histone fold domain-containing protein n=1 Tax=Mugilogobius chulae TaxID=88201 RepID=A0AAW0PF21_9GOBI
MDPTEDLSARILLKHILNVETPRTPLTRSVAAQNSAPRRSGRLHKHDPGAHTPQGLLRRSLKQKMRESISSKPLPIKRRTASMVLKQTPGPASVLFDNGDTPRQILKKILLTEPVKSPVVNEQVESQKQLQQPSPDSSLQCRRPSIELSGLELSDLPIGNVETTVKRLNRKRPHRSLNVTAFENRLKGANDSAGAEESLEGHSTLSLSSSTSLSLKTPFIDVRTERKALQRRGSNRRKVSEEDFGAAVDKRQMGNLHGTSISAPGQILSETTYSEGFTFGLSKISEPDITTDVVHCNTALYDQADGMMLNFSTLATQDKPTVMASQIQRDLKEQLDVDEEPYLFPTEENTGQSQLLSTHTDIHEIPCKDVGAPRQTEEEKSVANRTFDISGLEKLKKMGNADDSEVMNSSGTKDKADTQTGTQAPNDDVEEPEMEEPVSEHQSHQKGTDSQMNDESEQTHEEMEEEEEGKEVEDDKGEEEELVVEMAERENDETEGEKRLEQTETDMEGVEEEEEVEDEDENEGEEEELEEEIPEKEDDEIEGEKRVEHTETDVEGVKEEDSTAGDSEDKLVEIDSDKDEDGNSEHITQRALCPESELIMPIQNTDIDLPDSTKPEYYESSIQKDEAVEACDSENKENTFQENGPPEDAGQLEHSGEDSEDDDEEDEDNLGNTPTFVKQKRIFFLSDSQASSFSPKNLQPSDAGPGPKSKQKAQRKPRSVEDNAGLPKSYLMNVFKHFAKAKVSTDVYPHLKDVMNKFFDRLAKDLEAYALHARRTTIDFADCELLLRRQGHVNDKVPVEVLIEKYLRMDQRKLLIPIATSGNVVIPKRK